MQRGWQVLAIALAILLANALYLGAVRTLGAAGLLPAPDRFIPPFYQAMILSHTVLGLAIAVLGFLWIAYLGFAKFNEARQGKAEWAEVGVLGIVGAIVLIFASYLLTEAAGVI